MFIKIISSQIQVHLGGTSPAQCRFLAVFRRLLSPHAAHLTPGGSSVLPTRFRFFTPSVAFASSCRSLAVSLKSSALPCSPYGANISTLQGSLHVSGCWFALLPQEDRTLYHPGTRAAPPVTQKLSRQRPATRRPDPLRRPASRRQLIRTHQRVARRQPPCIGWPARVCLST